MRRETRAAPTTLSEELPLPISVAILAGGQSRRMGRDKSTLSIGGLTLLDRVFQAAVPLADEIMLISNRTDSTEWADRNGVRVFADKRPGCGPLSGLHTALLRATSPSLLLIGCDLPFLTARFLRFVAASLDGYEIALPRDDHGLQPLCAAYSRTCLSVVEAALAARRLEIHTIHQELNARILERAEWRELDPDANLLTNVNTLEDLEAARSYLER